MNNTKKIALNGLVGALYIVLTMVNPLSYGALQFRVSTMLLPLVGFVPCHLGLIVGTAIANFNSTLGTIDVIAGIIICSVYCLGVSKIKNKMLCSLAYALDSGIIVSLELYYCFKTPILYNIITVGFSGFVVHMIGMYLMKEIYKHILKQAGN